MKSRIFAVLATAGLILPVSMRAYERLQGPTEVLYWNKTNAHVGYTLFGVRSNNGNGGPDNVENPHPKQLYAMTECGIDFMARQVKAGKPFYLQLSHYAARQGGGASPQALAAVKAWGANLNERQTDEAAADWDLDLVLGMVLKKLDELGIADNTYVIFATDHRSPGRNPPLAGGKGTVSEGGLRVPFIIRGQGVPAGACTHVRGTGEDLFPTIAALAGALRRG